MTDPGTSLDLQIDDVVEWRTSPRLPGWRARLPNTLQLPDSDLWRVQYLFRNQAYLSRRQAGARLTDRAFLAVNAVVKIGAFTAAGLLAGRRRMAVGVARASIAGACGRLGRSYPLP